MNLQRSDSLCTFPLFNQECALTALLCGTQGAVPSRMTDVYSFAVTLFEIFTRQEPYEEFQDVQDVLEMLGDLTLDPPLRPAIPEGMPHEVSEREPI